MQLFYPTPKVYDRGGACPVVAAHTQLAHAADSTGQMPVHGTARTLSAKLMWVMPKNAPSQRGAKKFAETGSGQPDA